MKFRGRTIYPLIFWTMIVFCFFVFPLFLLYLSINRYFSLIERDRKLSDLSSVRKTLAQVKHDSDSSNYLHRVLSKCFDRQKMSEDIEKELAKSIASLKKTFPGSLEFIVWNAEGNLVEDLCDNTDYNFLKRRLNIFLKDLREFAGSGQHVNNLPAELKRQVRSYRQFLGPFISSSKIAESFASGDRGACFKMHGKGRQAWGWYTARPEFSVLVYISHELATSLIYPDLFCQHKQGIEHKFFMINERTWQVRPETSPEEKRQLLLNMARNSALVPPENISSENSLFSYQRVSPEWWIAAVSDQSSGLELRRTGKKLLLRFFAAVFIGSFILRCYLLVHANPFVSIRWKLMVIFAYTVAIPLMIFTTVGFEHLAQHQSIIENHYGLELANILTRVDLQFEVFLKNRADKVTRLADKLFGTSFVDNQLEAVITQLIRESSPVSVLLIDTEGNNLPGKKYSGKAANFTLLRTLAADLLEFLNDRALTEIRPFKVVSESMLQSHARVDRTIRLFQHAQGDWYFYQCAVRSPVDAFYRYCLQLFWDKEKFQEDYFAEIAARLRSQAQVESILFFPASNRAASQSMLWSGADDFIDQVLLHGLRVEKLPVSGKNFLVAGMRGQSLSDSVILVMMSDDKILSVTDSQKRDLWVLLCVMFLLAFALYRILNFQILNPVNQLIKGVAKINAGVYSYRIPFKSDNELGRLCGSVNHALENLQELVIAQVVQEALLPDNLPQIAGYELYAGTRPMTRLGGDYYDYFVNRSGQLIVVMADVAGHGVQAALLMAMAKSAILVGQSEENNGMAIMQRLNQTFCHLRKSAISTMLTCQVLTFQPDSGDCTLINAGHCPPLTVSQDREVVINHFKTLPLGYNNSRVFEQTGLNVRPGETLILYSDGIIEALNEKDEMLGQEGFINVVKASCNSDLKTFYDNMYARYESWRSVQNDDITFVLIRRTADAG